MELMNIIADVSELEPILGRKLKPERRPLETLTGTEEGHTSPSPGQRSMSVWIHG